MKCCLCGGEIEVQPISGWDGGHNAAPLSEGRCCDLCNTHRVIPERIARIVGGTSEVPPYRH
jgi:hypothetical protein